MLLDVAGGASELDDGIGRKDEGGRIRRELGPFLDLICSLIHICEEFLYFLWAGGEHYALADVKLEVVKELTVQPGPVDIDDHGGEGDGDVTTCHVLIHVLLALLMGVGTAESEKSIVDAAGDTRTPG